MKEVIRRTIAAQIEAMTFGMPVMMENQPDPPAAKTKWMRAGIRFGEEKLAAIGLVHTRMIGQIWMQIFLPADTGTSSASQAADVLSSRLAFKQLVIGDVGWTGTINFDGVDGPTPSGKRESYQQFGIVLTWTADKLTVA
jgi:hypothetical protein